jgi:AbrB family looped-hinge helix DNA binding protein
VVKLDRKGRIILPFHVRDYLELKEGMEMLISNNEKNELKIFPLFTGKTADIKIMLEDKIGSLNKILDVIEKNKMHILMSTSKTIEKGSLAEWSAIVDVSNLKDIKKMENELRSLDITKKLWIEKK